jgi:hypothetical protein
MGYQVSAHAAWRGRLCISRDDSSGSGAAGRASYGFPSFAFRTQSSGNIGQGAAAFMARAALSAMCFPEVAEPLETSSVRVPLSPPLT